MKTHVMSKTNPEVPRRSMVPERTTAEHAISRAVQAVERTGCHPLLTEAVILLGEAQGKVADYVDSQNQDVKLSYEAALDVENMLRASVNDLRRDLSAASRRRANLARQARGHV